LDLLEDAFDILRGGELGFDDLDLILALFDLNADVIDLGHGLGQTVERGLLGVDLGFRLVDLIVARLEDGEK
jgi:hypothetical protein